MKRTSSLLVLFVFLLCQVVDCKKYNVLDDALIARVNSDPKMTWVAGRNLIFENMTLDFFIHHKLGGILTDELPAFISKQPPPWRPEDLKKLDAGLPEIFSPERGKGTLDAWPAGCVGAIRNQGNCGSCWAFSAVETLADRFCIWSNGATNIVLSPQDLVSCDHEDQCGGCGGGSEAGAWSWMMNPGVVPESCFPYEGTDTSCPDSCPSGQSIVLYKAQNAYAVAASNIMSEIYTHGPVQACFQVYADLVHYAGGVYQHTSGGLLGGHCVKLTGWGVLNGIPYWTVANSWGTGWGPYGGFFMIRRGVNECGIEGAVVAGYPLM